MAKHEARILIIDDSEVIRGLLSEYLRDQGFEVDTALDGQDGIDKALAGDYDLVFCDLHMPKRNGYQVFSEVTAAKKHLKFIMTDSLPDELAAMAEDAGAYGCITKPFDLLEVSKKVSQALGIAEEEWASQND